MRLRTTSELPCQAWTVTLFSALITLGGLAQTAVCAWLLVFSSDFVVIIGDPMRNVFFGYIVLGSFVFITSALGGCFALIRNKTGLVLYGGFLAASMVCQAGLWTFIYFEQREVTTPEGLQKRIMKNLDSVGQVLDEKFLCRLGIHGNSTEEFQLCGGNITNWLVTISTVLWGLSAALICIQFLTLIMVAMLRVLVSEVQSRDRVVDFYDAEVTDHDHAQRQPANKQQLPNRSSRAQESENDIYDHLGHIEYNCSCHTDQPETLHVTTINL